MYEGQIGYLVESGDLRDGGREERRERRMQTKEGRKGSTREVEKCERNTMKDESGGEERVGYTRKKITVGGKEGWLRNALQDVTAAED